MWSDLYAQGAVTNVECQLSNTDQALKTHVSTPTVPGYQPELNAIPELDAWTAAYSQSLIGVL